MSRKLFIYFAAVCFAVAASFMVPGLQENAYAGAGRVSKSTKVAARLNPIGSGRGGSFNGISAILKYRKAQAKYQAKLYKFQLKKAKKAIKQRKKLERKREAALRKERRALERKLAKLKVQQQKAKQAAAQQGKDQTTTPASVESGSVNDKGESTAARKVTTVEGSAPAKSKRQKSFWSKLWMSLVGRK